MKSLKKHLETILTKPSPEPPPQNFAAVIDSSIDYLNSKEAADSLTRDPYWPKWHSPWWHVLLLSEMGLAQSIPRKTIETLANALDQYYLKCFPSREEDVPDGIDPLNQIPCHCQLGTIEQVLRACAIDSDPRLNWLNDWYLNYQIADGGLNCDESAYNKTNPKSSIVSTLPPLEAVLSRRQLSEKEIDFLDKGAQYLIERQLCFRKGTSQFIDQDFLSPVFPRFYHYDVLRGLSFLVAWSKKLSRRLPIDSFSEVVLLIDSKFPDGLIKIERQVWTNCPSRFPGENGKEWYKAEATSFPLLETVSSHDDISPYLTAIWSDLKRDLISLYDRELLQSLL